MYKLKSFFNKSCKAIKKVAKSNAMKKTLMVAFVVAFNVVGAWAQSTGASSGVTGISNATSTFGLYIPEIKKLIYVIAAIVAMVGSFSIYFKMQNGDQDVKKSILMTVGGCVALVTMAEALPLIFNVTVSGT